MIQNDTIVATTVNIPATIQPTYRKTLGKDYVSNRYHRNALTPYAVMQGKHVASST
jgi:hypothetical protein